jgi:hypothetical protein
MPPPQAGHVITVSSTHKRAKPQSSRPYRVRGRLPSNTIPGTIPDKPESASHSANLLRPGAKLPGYVKRADPPAVETETVITAGAAPLSFTELGETEHEDCAGAPLQVKVTVWLNPPPGATATV